MTILDECVVDPEEEKFLFFLLLQMQKLQLKDFKRTMRTIVECGAILWIHQRKVRYQSKKILLLPIFLSERGVEPTVIKKANQFVFFKIGFFQLLDVMKFLKALILFRGIQDRKKAKRFLLTSC